MKNAWLNYILIRLGLFVGVLVILIAIGLDKFVSALFAAMISLAISLIFFTKQRDRVSEAVYNRINRNDTGPLMLHLAHATQPEKDLKLMLVPDADGHFSVALPMLERSRWVVLVEGEKREWRLAGAWVWPANHGITLLPD